MCASQELRTIFKLIVIHYERAEEIQNLLQDLKIKLQHTDGRDLKLRKREVDSMTENQRDYMIIQWEYLKSLFSKAPTVRV